MALVILLNIWGPLPSYHLSFIEKCSGRVVIGFGSKDCRFRVPAAVATLLFSWGRALYLDCLSPSTQMYKSVPARHSNFSGDGREGVFVAVSGQPYTCHLLRTLGGGSAILLGTSDNNTLGWLEMEFLAYFCETIRAGNWQNMKGAHDENFCLRKFGPLVIVLSLIEI